jgi:hypothetical protein
VLDCGATPGGLASTLVALHGPTAELLREGPVPFAAVLTALHSK